MADSQKDKKKQMIVLAGGVVFLIILVIFGSAKLMTKEEEALPSNLSHVGGSPEKIKTSEVSHEYRLQMEAFNKKASQEAEAKGVSSLPALLPQQVQEVTPPTKDNPYQPSAQQQRNSSAPQAQNSAASEANRNEAARAMANALLQQPYPGSMTITAVNSEIGAAGVLPARNLNSVPGIFASPVSGREASKITGIGAGDTLFAVLESEINTDQKDFVRASITHGPLKGAQLIGTATREDEVVKVVINTLFWRQKSFDLNAQLMDIETARGLLSGQVDRKLFVRFGLPFLSGLVSGLGTAIAQGSSQMTATPATTVVTTSKLDSRQIAGAAIGSGATAVTRQFQEVARNSQVSVTIPAGSPVGVYLFSDITEKTGAISSQNSATTSQNPLQAANSVQQAAIQTQFQEIARLLQQQNLGLNGTLAPTLNMGVNQPTPQSIQEKLY